MYSAPIDNELMSPSPRRPSNASAASSAAVSSNTGANPQPQTRHEHTRTRQTAGGVGVAVTSASSGPLAEFHMAQHDDVSSVPDTPITPGTAGTVGTGHQQFSTAADGAATNSAAPSRMLSNNASFAHAGGSHTDDVDRSTTDAAPDSHHPRQSHQQQQLRPSGSVEMERVPMASTNPNDVAMQRRNPATWAYIKGQLEDQQRQRLHRWREQRQVERERFTSLPRDGASPSVSPAVVSSRQTSPATRPMHRQQPTTGGSASSAGPLGHSHRDHAEHDQHQTHRGDPASSGRTRERRSSPQARQVQPPRPTLRSDGARVTSVSPTARRGQVPGHERLTNMYDPTDVVQEDARLVDESAFTSFDVDRAPPQSSQGHHPQSQHPQRAQHDARGREISERDTASVMTPPAYLDSSSVADTQLSSNVEAGAHHVHNNARGSTAYDRSGLVDTPAAVRPVAGRDNDRVQVGEWQDTSVSAVAAPTGDVERHASSHVTSRRHSERDAAVEHLERPGHSAEPSITQQSPIDRGATTSPHQDNGSDPSAAASVVPRGRVTRPSDNGVASHPYRGDELELERPTHPSVTATSDQQLELDQVSDAERVHSSRRGSGVDSHRSRHDDGVAALRGQSATAYGSSMSVDAVEAALDAATINRDAALYLHHEQQRQHREVLSALHGIEDSVKKKVLEALHMDDGHRDGDHSTENTTQETQSTHRSTLEGQHRRSRGDSGRTERKHTPRRGGNDTSAKEKDERDARRRSARSRSPASRLQHAPHRLRTPTSRSLSEADNRRAVAQHAMEQGHEEQEEDLASLRARVLGTTSESELTDEERKARLVAQLLAVGGGRPPRPHAHHSKNAGDVASNDGGHDRDLRGLGEGSELEHKSGAQTRSTLAAESEPSHAQPMTLSEESDLRRAQQHTKHSASASAGGGWPTRPWERNDAYPSSDPNGTSGGASRSMSEAAPGYLSHAEASSTRSYSGSSSITGGRIEDLDCNHRQSERRADGQSARQQHEPAHDDYDCSVVDENDSDADESLRQSAIIRKLKMELAAANAKIKSLEGDVTSLRDQVKSKDDLLHKVVLQHRKTAAKAVADVTPSKTERPDNTSADPDAIDQDRRVPQAPAITNAPTADRPTARVRPAMVTPVRPTQTSNTMQQTHQRNDESLVHTPAASTQQQTPAALHQTSSAGSKLHSDQLQKEEQLPKAPQFQVQSSAWNDLRLGLSATLPMNQSMKSSNTQETTDLTALQSTANAAAASAAVASAENGAKRRATAKVQQRFPLRAASGAQDSLPQRDVPPHPDRHVDHRQSALALQQHQGRDATASTAAHASAVASALNVSGIQALPDSTSVASEAARKEEEARLDEARQKALLAARDSITSGGGVSVSDLRRALQDHEQSRRAMLQTLKYGKEAEAQPRATNNIAA